MERAARHIAAVFQAARLTPGGDAGSYRQSFTVPTGVRLGARNSLAVAGVVAPPLALGRDFMPLTVSSDGYESGELVFAGYGISAPDLHYDDYAGLDAKGKIVLALSGEPRPDDPASPFRRPTAYHYSERRHKIINAREHGARAIILVTRSGTTRAALPDCAASASRQGSPRSRSLRWSPTRCCPRQASGSTSWPTSSIGVRRPIRSPCRAPG